MDSKKIGSLSFLVGILIAILAGFFDIRDPSTARTILSVLAVLGLIVGFLNITVGEATPFLVASIALIVVGMGVNLLPLIPIFGEKVGVFVSNVLANILIFVSPAAIVVALMTIYMTASEK